MFNLLNGSGVCIICYCKFNVGENHQTEGIDCAAADFYSKVICCCFLKGLVNRNWCLVLYGLFCVFVLFLLFAVENLKLLRFKQMELIALFLIIVTRLYVKPFHCYDVT